MHISYNWLCYFHLVSILFSSICSFSIIVDFTDFVQQISFCVPDCFIFQLSICFGTFEINGKVLFPNTVSNQFRISTCSELIYKWVFGVTIPLKKRYQINSSFWHFSLEHFCDEAKKDLMLPKKNWKEAEEVSLICTVLYVYVYAFRYSKNLHSHFVIYTSYLFDLPVFCQYSSFLTFCLCLSLLLFSYSSYSNNSIFAFNSFNWTEKTENE